jgi:hypothetical protein
MPEAVDELLMARKRSQFDVTKTEQQQLQQKAPTAPQPGMLKLVDGKMVDASGNVVMIPQPEPELKV